MLLSSFLLNATSERNMDETETEHPDPGCKGYAARCKQAANSKIPSPTCQHKNGSRELAE
jgi:hypothetical protein